MTSISILSALLLLLILSFPPASAEPSDTTGGNVNACRSSDGGSAAAKAADVSGNAADGTAKAADVNESAADGSASATDANAGSESSSTVTGSGTEPLPSDSYRLPFKYVGNSFSSKFHRPSCIYARAISGRHMTYFVHRHDATDAGFVPCRWCLPPNWKTVHVVLLNPAKHKNTGADELQSAADAASSPSSESAAGSSAKSDAFAN